MLLSIDQSIQSQPSDLTRPATFTSHCESVSGKMWTVQQMAEFVLWHSELKSVVTVWSGKGCMQEKKYRMIRLWIIGWNTSKTCEVLQNWNLQVNQKHRKIMWTARLSCVTNPKKSTACRSLELRLPKTIQNVIHMHLRLYSYKIQLGTNQFQFHTP